MFNAPENKLSFMHMENIFLRTLIIPKKCANLLGLYNTFQIVHYYIHDTR